jgi:predicted HicB family RNase H-like nuclease
MIMQLEGYVARIDYDEDEKTFRGKVAKVIPNELLINPNLVIP